MGGIAVASYGLDARADEAACSAEAEQGQAARAEGRLRAAHRHFLACSSLECPAPVMTDCTQRAAEVLGATPTVVVDAQDDLGHDVGDATLTIDGVVVTRQLDGKAIPLDPGSHTLTLQRTATSPAVTQTILVQEGVKARPIKLRLPGGYDPNMAARTIDGHTIGPWAVVGVGAITLAIGIALAATAPSLPSSCDDATKTCRPRPGQTAASPDFARDRDQAGQHEQQPIVGASIAALGAAVVGGGLLWHFLETPKPRNASIAPWLLAGSAGLSARGSF